MLESSETPATLTDPPTLLLAGASVSYREQTLRSDCPCLTSLLYSAEETADCECLHSHPLSTSHMREIEFSDMPFLDESSTPPFVYAP